MAFTPTITHTFLLLTVLVILLPAETYAFGAGDIPDFAYLNDKAFRHGDIENILETLSKSVKGHHLALGGGSLLGMAGQLLKHAAGSSKFSKSDVKKVYFGNWLRDYSQAMDIAGLSKLSADTLILVVSVLGFMTFGFATQEFEVTAERLGVYLPVEHIDNPKGYAEKEGDARQFHPKLRPPVDNRELEFDDNTGMKKYMATENQGWDTSTAFIRRTFQSCIQHAREAQGQEGPHLWEAYRCLGTGLHTMEDLLAHSNWCEIALRKLGYNQVFCHVGDNVTINTPNGRAPPLVTGTFGSADFLHSLLGEAGDKLSQASVTDLSQKMDSASQGGGGNKPDIGALKNIMSKFGGGDDKLNKGEEIKQQSQGYNFDPDNIAPPEVQKQLLDLLKWHDDVMRDIIKKIEMVPGLTNLLEEFSNAMNEYVYTVLAPYLGPILTQATGVLDEGSKAVIDNDDQYAVFDNPDAHDPSHSLLSKDHFGLILNEPAGKIAQVVVEHSVNLLVRAWSDNSNPDDVINQILEAFHHPYYATGRSEIQNKMFDTMQKWIGGMGSEANEIIESLTKEAVREHRNKRKGLEDTIEPGYGGCGHGSSTGGFKKPQTVGATGGYGGSKTSSYGRTDNSSSHNTGNTGSTYGSSQGQYGGTTQTSNTYGSQRRDDDNSGYGGSGGGHGGRKTETPSYGGGRQDDTSGGGYGGSGYGSQQTHGSSGYGGQKRDEDSSYGGGHGTKRHDDNTPSYGGGGYGGKKRDDDTPSYGSGGYGSHKAKRDDDTPSYGVQKRDDNTPSYGGGYAGQKRDDDTPSYGGGHGGKQVKQHHRKDDDDDNRGSGYSSRTETGSYTAASYSQTNVSSDNSYSQTTSSYGATTYGGGDDNSGGYGKKSYGRDGDSDDEKKKKKHGQSGYGGGGGGGYGQSDTTSGHGGGVQSGYGGGQSYGQTGSTAGYAPSYGGQSDTFGAERLNIGGGRGGDDSDEEKKRRRNKHRDDY